MKKILLAAWLLSMTTFFAQAGQPAPAGLPFTIQGTAPAQQSPVKVILTIRGRSGTLRMDSTEVRQGHFVFNGTIPEPVLATLSFIRQDQTPGASKGPAGGHSRSDELTLFLDKGVITITTTDLIGKATVKGSAAQDAMTALNTELKDLIGQATELQKQYGGLMAAKDTEGLKKAEIRRKEIWAAMHTIKVAYVKNNPSSPIAPWVLDNFSAYYLDVAEVGPLYDHLSPGLKTTPTGKDIGDRLTTFRKTAVGQPAPDFSQPDTSGRMVSLSSYKGKYVLVDFWASWCHICRLENAYVLKAYNTYKDKGFTVLTVSLDTDKAKWEEAFNKDGMIWTTISDLKTENEVALQYGVAGIPKSVLVDPSGMIIAKNLRGDDLGKKLEEVFTGK